MLVIKLLQRISYGPTPKSIQEAQDIGYEAFVKKQLTPTEQEDQNCYNKLKNYEFPIRFNKKGKKIDNQWSFKYLNATLPELWEIKKDKKRLARAEKKRPQYELIMATWIRAVYSKWQLKELLVDFWHNHFNVNADANDAIAILLPHYDRAVIRKNCLGNFRVFLEDVAKHPCMLYYLNNAMSKASPANENYARELFELHGLGAKNYLNHLYNRWREVPGALEGKPEGYIDEDVYEAARAFTGWTVADGRRDEKGGRLPDTGMFYYFEGWHDNYQKRVLGIEFPPNQAPLEDGRQVLDLIAFHPATAQHICYKICKRFVEDEPSEALVRQATQLWIKLQNATDQIKQVLEFIFLHKHFKASLGLKIKRPPELVFGYIRALGAVFNPNRHLIWMFNQMGYHFFSWSAPTGHPVEAHYWISSNMLLNRWNIMVDLLYDWHQLIQVDLKEQLENQKTVREIATFWATRLFGHTNIKSMDRAVQFLAAGGVEDETPFGTPQDIKNQILQMIALFGMSPEFQYC